jgi:hypothetical protein
MSVHMIGVRGEKRAMWPWLANSNQTYIVKLKILLLDILKDLPPFSFKTSFILNANQLGFLCM